MVAKVEVYQKNEFYSFCFPVLEPCSATTCIYLFPLHQHFLSWKIPERILSTGNIQGTGIVPKDSVDQPTDVAKANQVKMSMLLIFYLLPYKAVFAFMTNFHGFSVNLLQAKLALLRWSCLQSARRV